MCPSADFSLSKASNFTDPSTTLGKSEIPRQHHGQRLLFYSSVDRALSWFMQNTHRKRQVEAREDILNKAGPKFQ